MCVRVCVYVCVCVCVSTEESKKGAYYSRWQLSDLEGASVTLFLFGDAHKELYKEELGSVVILYNAKVCVTHKHTHTQRRAHTHTDTLTHTHMRVTHMHTHTVSSYCAVFGLSARTLKAFHVWYLHSARNN